MLSSGVKMTPEDKRCTAIRRTLWKGTVSVRLNWMEKNRLHTDTNFCFDSKKGAKLTLNSGAQKPANGPILTVRRVQRGGALVVCRCSAESCVPMSACCCCALLPVCKYVEQLVMKTVHGLLLTLRFFCSLMLFFLLLPLHDECWVPTMFLCVALELHLWLYRWGKRLWDKVSSDVASSLWPAALFIALL